MVQATLVMSRLTFLMASSRNWDADTTRSNIPLVMYLDALCYRLQALSSANPRAGTPRNPDPLFVFKMVLSSVKKSYEKRVANIKPDVFVVDRRGHCPILDPSLQQYFSFDGPPTPMLADDWDDMGTPNLSATDSSGMGWCETGNTPDFSPIGTACVNGVGAPLYYDLWATMTSSWADNINVSDLGEIE